ncbi:hypothetical protein CRYUN_Cryun01aG0108500 [Craigia yunnanensis]
MDFSIVKGVAEDGLTMEWIKLKTLGKGSYGVVDLVKPTKSVSDDRVFAVKSCLYQDSDSLQKKREILERFAGCGKIVQCYGDMLSIDHGILVYNLVLEYAPGGIRDIHQRGYVHCDLKPANILVCPSDGYSSINSLMIADFGLARQPGGRDIPEVETFPGTPVYMPPESVIDGKISAALDIWSLGCVLLEMITRKLPWECQNLRDLTTKVAFSRNPPKIPRTMSSTGKDCLMKCFARDPSERWTVNMLLSHPFLLADYPSLPSPTKSPHYAQYNSCLPSMEKLEAMYLALLDI